MPSFRNRCAPPHVSAGFARTALLAVGAACVILLGCSPAKSTVTPQPKSVTVATVTRENITITQEYPSKIKPSQEVTVSSKVSGRIAAVDADVGDAVRSGQPLFALDAADYRAHYRQAVATLDAAKANLARTNESTISGEILQAQAAVDQAQVQYSNAQSLYQKTKTLFDSGSIPQTQYDTVHASYRSAQIALDTAKQNLALIQQKGGPQSIAVQEAQVDQAQAAVDLAKSQLDNTVITSPIDGVVAVRNVDAGELVSSSVPAFVVIDSGSVKAEIGVSGSVIDRVHTGEPVTISVPAAGAGSIEGHIDTVSPAVDPRTQSYLVSIAVANPDGRIKPGMFARVRLTVAVRTGVLVVPNRALVVDGGSSYLFVVRGSTVHKIAIETGLATDTVTEVTSGVAAGELVVTQGQSFLSDGDRVTIVP